MEIRVAIFEDNKLVRDALAAILNGTPGFSCCGAWPDGDHWKELVAAATPDVILMDIELPGKNGLELTQLIHARFPDIRLLIQTVFNDHEKIFLALCAGASGYILKSDSPQKYLDAITELYNGAAHINPVVAKKLLGFFTNKNIVLMAPSGEDYRLSDREKELLRLMTEGFNYRDIAAKAFISYETVRTHVKHIYKKLHVASRSEAVMKAVQQGICSK